MSRSFSVACFAAGSLALASFAVLACGSFSSSSDDGPVANTDAAVDVAATETAVEDAAPPTEAGGADASPPSGCQGDFLPPRTIIVGAGLNNNLRSLRGTVTGTFIVSFDTSPDDNMGTATLTATTLSLDAVNRFDPLNGTFDESAPTAADDLGFVLFTSNRPPGNVDPDAGTVFSLLFRSKFTGTFSAAQNVPVVGFPAQTSVNNPYVVGQRVYFDSDGDVKAGELPNDQLIGVIGVLGIAGNASHPVVTKDQREIFVQRGIGIQRLSRAVSTLDFDPNEVFGTGGDYPTWISNDACHLYVIHGGTQLHIYDRQH